MVANVRSPSVEVASRGLTDHGRGHVEPERARLLRQNIAERPGALALVANARYALRHRGRVGHVGTGVGSAA